MALPSRAGTSLSIFGGASRLDDPAHMHAALTEGAAACSARLLNVNVHQFPMGAGVTGVAVLAESHISVHSWPEHGFAAFDVFVCGDCNPNRMLPVLRRYFAPTQIQVAEYKRGLIAHARQAVKSSLSPAPEAGHVV